MKSLVTGGFFGQFKAVILPDTIALITIIINSRSKTVKIPFSGLNYSHQRYFIETRQFADPINLGSL